MPPRKQKTSSESLDSTEPVLVLDKLPLNSLESVSSPAVASNRRRSARLCGVSTPILEESPLPKRRRRSSSATSTNSNADEIKVIKPRLCFRKSDFPDKISEEEPLVDVEKEKESTVETKNSIVEEVDEEIEVVDVEADDDGKVQQESSQTLEASPRKSKSSPMKQVEVVESSSIQSPQNKRLSPVKQQQTVVDKAITPKAQSASDKQQIDVVASPKKVQSPTKKQHTDVDEAVTVASPSKAQSPTKKQHIDVVAVASPKKRQSSLSKQHEDAATEAVASPKETNSALVEQQTGVDETVATASPQKYNSTANQHQKNIAEAITIASPRKSPVKQLENVAEEITIATPTKASPVKQSKHAGEKITCLTPSKPTVVNQHTDEVAASPRKQKSSPTKQTSIEEGIRPANQMSGSEEVIEVDNSSSDEEDSIEVVNPPKKTVVDEPSDDVVEVCQVKRNNEVGEVSSPKKHRNSPKKRSRDSSEIVTCDDDDVCEIENQNPKSAKKMRIASTEVCSNVEENSNESSITEEQKLKEHSDQHTQSKDKPKAFVLDKKSQDLSLGRRESGRFWKSSRDRFRSTIKSRGLKQNFKQRMENKEALKRAKDLEKSMKEDAARQREELKARQELNKKRREENAKKTEIVQVVKNPAKLKRMKKKQLRLLEKRDTTVVKK